MKKKNIIMIVIMILLGVLILISFIYVNHHAPREVFITDHDFDAITVLGWKCLIGMFDFRVSWHNKQYRICNSGPPVFVDS